MITVQMGTGARINRSAQSSSDNGYARLIVTPAHTPVNPVDRESWIEHWRLFTKRVGPATQLSCTAARRPTGNSERPMRTRATPVPGEWMLAVNQGLWAVAVVTSTALIAMAADSRVLLAAAPGLKLQLGHF